VAGILGCDQVDTGEHLHGARGQIPQISDGRGHHMEHPTLN
jgi:hypothetical protein